MDAKTEEIRQRADIVDIVGSHVTLVAAGNNRWKACCPFHDEKTPSFYVSRDKGFYKCFGCLDEDELIWTGRGLKRIGDIELADEVLDKNGKWQPVIAIEKKRGALLEIETAGFRKDPLRLTPDHTCLYVKGEHARAALPYLYLSSERGTRYKSSYRRYRVKNAIVTEGDADTIKAGDFLLFPVIAAVDRVANSLRATGVIASCTIGKKVSRIKELPVDAETAFLYGLYLAEGSTNLRSVRWSFHRDEKDLAASVSRILQEKFGLSSTDYLIPEKKIREVICSKTDLARHLEYWFGKGCGNKKIPAQVLSWPVEMQRALMNGYRCGDGNARGDTKSVSRELSYGLYALAIQCGFNPSLAFYDANVSSSGQKHREYWYLSNRLRQGLAGFFEEVDGVNYYWSQVSKVSESVQQRPVVDITVANTHSFTTKLAAVHNCGKSGDVFRFLMETENVTFPEARRMLADRYGIALPQFRPQGGEGAEGEQETPSEREQLGRVMASAAAYFRDQFTGNAGLAARDYARSRGLSRETLEKFGIGYAPDGWDGLRNHLLTRFGFSVEEAVGSGLLVAKEDAERSRQYDRFRHRLMFPIWDASGRVIAFGGRALEGGETGNPDAKYINSPEGLLFKKSQVLYAYHLARAEAGKRGSILITEGYMDAIALHEAGFSNTVATLGTALTTQHVALLRRLSPRIVYLCFDGDSAGMRAALRAAPLFAANNLDVRVVSLPVEDDPDTYIRKHGEVGFENELRRAKLLKQYQVEMAVAEFDLSDLAQRKEAVRAASEVIAETPDATEKDSYVMWLASHWARAEGITSPQRLEMVEAAVRREVAAAQKRWAKQQNAQHRQHQPVEERAPEGYDEEDTSALAEIGATHANNAPPGVFKAERALLSTLLSSPSWRGHILEKLAPQHWTQPAHREIAAALVTYQTEDEEPLSPNQLIEKLPDDTGGLIAELLLSDDAQLAATDRVIDDWIARVHNHWDRQREADILHLVRTKLEQGEEITVEERTLYTQALIKTKRKPAPPPAALK